ncbi:hypothetical protein PMAC_003409 [Pneumocystis sp. 'macacae']|nr:hypothetical protein PMAC_003409 [Pneumocystis sp. 'macacae']
MRQEGRCARGSEISVCTKQQGMRCARGTEVGWGRSGVKKVCTEEIRWVGEGKCVCAVDKNREGNKKSKGRNKVEVRLTLG